MSLEKFLMKPGADGAIYRNASQCCPSVGATRNAQDTGNSCSDSLGCAARPGDTVKPYPKKNATILPRAVTYLFCPPINPDTILSMWFQSLLAWRLARDIVKLGKVTARR